MLAYVTIERGPHNIEVPRPTRAGRPSYTWVQGWQARVLVSFSDRYPVGYISPCMVRAEVSHYCTQMGFETRLPALSQIEACTRDKCPHFFDRSTRRTLDRSHGAHALKVQRGPDGSIQVTNGRTSWVWTGDDLRTIIGD